MEHEVYISSSWKQRDRVRALAEMLRRVGVTVYDFTDPACRNAPEIPPEAFPEQFDPAKGSYEHYLRNVPHWKQAVDGNRKALDVCKVVILLLPCGNDAHADWAYGLAKGAYTIVAGHPKAGERTPSHLWCDKMVATDEEAGAYALSALLANDEVSRAQREAGQ
jgi:hypothetical protein